MCVRVYGEDGVRVHEWEICARGEQEDLNDNGKAQCAHCVCVEAILIYKCLCLPALYSFSFHLFLLFLLFMHIESTLKTSYVIRGQSTSLTCPIAISTCGELHSIKWFKGSERIAVASGDGKFTQVEGPFSER